MIELEVPFELSGQRLDQVAADLCPDYSRSQLQKWIHSGDITVNGAISKSRAKVFGGDKIAVRPQQQEQINDQPEDIPLDIVYEDNDILVINKPAGLVVHPAAGNPSGTLVNALLYHHVEQQNLPRAGIVHRLDKDTSGLMVVAKTLQAHKSLVEQLQARSVKREYLALVQGELIAGGMIEGNIGRHPGDRKKMAVVGNGKPAVTHYRIEERFQGFTLLRVNLETGRTHQIRVHMSWKHMPIAGDPVYMGRPRIPKELHEDLRNHILGFPRQALHATRLALIHPRTGEEASWKCSMPDDMQALVLHMRDERDLKDEDDDFDDDDDNGWEIIYAE